MAANRSILLNADDDVSEPALRHCVALALTYHLNKRRLRVASPDEAKRKSGN